MASSSQFLLLLSCFLYIFRAQSSYPSNAIVIPVTKDGSTLQYVTDLYIGNPLLRINLVVDLGGRFLWADCASGYVSSSSRRLISGCSIQCSMASRVPNRGSESCARVNNTCDVFPENSITRLTTRGVVVEDILAVHSLDGSKAVQMITTVNQFLFSCAPSFLLQGLPSGANGMLGLGRSPTSLPSQLATAIGHRRKFAVCLSSSNGVILSGDGASDLIFGTEISRSLIYTPLIINQGDSSHEYFMNAKSIKINGKKLSINKSLLSVNEQGKGGTKLSTTVPYTTMESSIYATFTRAYMKAAASMNMTRVTSVAPFGLCFSSKGIDTVPSIDIVLQSEMVKWKINGKNSMVRVSDEVMCLGFVDGGLNSKTAIVIGGFQLENHLLDFDLSTSMLGFSSRRQTSCSNFMSDSMLRGSL